MALTTPRTTMPMMPMITRSSIIWNVTIKRAAWLFAAMSFRSPDLSGGAKALWFLFVLFIPLIGVLFYLIFRGGTMNERSVW
jgi:hypothetical protein